MNIKQTLKSFGLEEKEQEIYLLLLKHDWQTVLEISKLSPIKRTTLYRVLESLQKKGLIEMKLDDKTTFYSAASPNQFKSLVLEQEDETKNLKTALPNLLDSLNALTSIRPGETTVRYYRGLRGLKQLEWKKYEEPNKQILVFGAKLQWMDVLGRSFAEQIRDEAVAKNIQIKELLNENAIEPIMEGIKTSWTDNQEYVLKHFQHRQILKKKLHITQDLYITHNGIHFHGYREGDLVGIEIISDDFSKMFGQIFKSFWNQATVVDKNGGQNLK
jgi:sugar-specific transcriptional regulator TrmB